MKTNGLFFRGWFQKKSKNSPPRQSEPESQEIAKPEAILPDPFREKHKKSILKKMGSRSEKEQQIAALQAGYFELIDLIRSISQHLDKQGETQKQLVDTLPKAIHSIENVARTTEQQNSTLALLQDEMKNSLAGSMNKLSDTLIHMDTTRRQSETTFQNILERSEKRFHVLIGLLLLLLIPAIGTPLYFSTLQSGPLQPAGSASALNTQAAISMPLLPQEPANAPSSEAPADSVVESVPLATTVDHAGEIAPVESITLGQPLPTETLMVPEPTPVESQDKVWLQQAPDSAEFYPDPIETAPENGETLASDKISEDHFWDDTLLSEERIVGREDNSQEPLWKWVV